jgi:hypothetical protein
MIDKSVSVSVDSACMRYILRRFMFFIVRSQFLPTMTSPTALKSERCGWASLALSFDHHTTMWHTNTNAGLLVMQPSMHLRALSVSAFQRFSIFYIAAIDAECKWVMGD